MSTQEDLLSAELLNAILPESPKVSAVGYAFKLFLLLLVGAMAIGTAHYGIIAFSSTGLLNEGWGWGALLVYCLQVAAAIAMPWYSYCLYRHGQAFPAYLHRRLDCAIRRMTAVQDLNNRRMAGAPDDVVALQQLHEDLRKRARTISTDFLAEDTLLNQVGAWVGCLAIFSCLSFLTCLALYPGLAQLSFALFSCVHLTAYALMVSFVEGHTPLAAPSEMRVPHFTLSGVLLFGYFLTFLGGTAPVTYPDSRSAATAIVTSVKTACALKADEVAIPKDYPYTATVCDPVMLAYLDNSVEAVAKGIDQLHVKDFSLQPPPRERFPDSVANAEFWERPVLRISQSSHLSVAHLRRFHALAVGTPSNQVSLPTIMLERH